MKKGLVILMALAFLGGVAFAEEGDPTVTFGVDSYAGVNVVKNNTSLENKEGVAELEAVPMPWFGSLKSSDDYGYWVEPWFKFEDGIFFAKVATIFDGWKDDLSEDSFTRYELTMGVTGDGYALEDRIRLDNKESTGTSQVRHRIKASVSMDNVGAKVAFAGDGVNNAPNALVFDDFFAPLSALELADYEFTINDLWGFTDVKVGGLSDDYYDENDYRYPAIDWFSDDDDNIASNNVASPAFLWVGTDEVSVPVHTTYNIGSLVEAVPLTIRTGVNVPITAVEYRDFLADNEMIISAEYALDGVGSFILGAIPAFANTRTNEAAGVYTKVTSPVMNNIFLDANISAIDNLELQAAFDFITMTMPSLDPAATTGTGAAATPFVTSEVTATGIGFGVEAIYDLSDVLAGLEVDLGLAIASLSGLTQLNTTGVAWVAPTAGANIYIADNYTEANVYGAPENFILGVGASYDINDNNSVSVSNEYINLAGDFSAIDTALGTTTSYGFYSTNEISLGYSVTAGDGKLSTSLGYVMYLGLPAASDYQITGNDPIATFDAAVANAYKPLTFQIKYSASF